jgi:hypothetical protein
VVDAWQLLRPHVRDESLCTREGGLGSAAIDDIPLTDHDGYRHGDAAQLVVGEHGRRRDSPEPTGQHAHRDQVDARVCGRLPDSRLRSGGVGRLRLRKLEAEWGC